MDLPLVTSILVDLRKKFAGIAAFALIGPIVSNALDIDLYGERDANM